MLLDINRYGLDDTPMVEEDGALDAVENGFKILLDGSVWKGGIVGGIFWPNSKNNS
ncbi:hypothetical protein LDG_5153 [Legionella drancourtii LLAP12]|uniref:Uncharacterized protein n=1 Tax=Legionella drancourtii LLAP12 TaxID=658187 RepID=G9EIZ6_9GAMM|nr:hypothetical protein LDG_5153 [Legionella drancourtii LLAP12]